MDDPNYGAKCDRCQSSHCCSVRSEAVPPLCVTDPEGSMPLWMPWTNEDVQKRLEPLWKRVDAFRAALTPSGETKAVHIGEHHFRLECLDDVVMCPTVTVPWDTIKGIMARIEGHADHLATKLPALSHPVAEKETGHG
jgi:hypothetical protein